MIRVSCDKCVEIYGSKIIIDIDGKYLIMTCSICGETISLKNTSKEQRE